jgi:recombination protein RecR
VSAIDDLNAELSRLPGIGRKTASRLIYHMLKQPKGSIVRLADSLTVLAERVKPCLRCGNMTEDETCALCTDPRRDDFSICVVEEASDIDAIEKTGEFRGRYHVLGGRLSPLDGVGPDDLAIEELRIRVSGAEKSLEIIIATNPSMEGEATATYLSNVLKSSGARVTRIALGLPVGGDLQYADGVTIAQAMAARREMPV